MSTHTVDLLLHRLADCGVDEVQFAFQGGEPLLWGYDNFSTFFDKVATRPFRASYALQTNGLALDEAFCHLLAQHDVLVGLSLDGDRELHDSHRITPDGKGTFDKVQKALSLLKRYGVRHNIVTVVTDRLARHPQQLYRFYKKLGVSHVQLISCLLPMGDTTAAVTSCAPSPAAYAAFLVTFYRLWREGFCHGKPPFYVREFDQYRLMLQGAGGFCGAGGRCTPQLIVEADGHLYPCDFYVLPAFQTGHLASHTLDMTLTSDGMSHFVRTYPSTPDLCRCCRYLSLCGGGCRRMRDVLLQDSRVCPLQKLFDFMIQKENFQP